MYTTSTYILIHPRTQELQNVLTLEDYQQVQALLDCFLHRLEQNENRRREQARLVQAMHNHKLLQLDYRRRRAAQLERLIRHHRQQLVNYDRAHLVAALEQQRTRQAFQRFIQQHASYQPSQTNDVEPLARAQEKLSLDNTAMEEEYDQYQTQQLSDLLKHLFERNTNEDEEDEEYVYAQAGGHQEPAEDEQTMADLVPLLQENNDKVSCQREEIPPHSDQVSESEDDDEQSFLPDNVVPLQNVLDDLIRAPTPAIGHTSDHPHREQVQQKQRQQALEREQVKRQEQERLRRRQQEEEEERQRHVEQQRQHQLEQEQQRQRQLERERQRQLEEEERHRQRLLEQERQRQLELEEQRQHHLEQERQRQLELEEQRQKQRQLEQEREEEEKRQRRLAQERQKQLQLDKEQRRQQEDNQDNKAYQAKMKQLDAIEQKLMQLGSPATKARILRIPLQYQQNDHHGLFLDGNTADNRAFLMYEDEIIQCMLQLDQVLSEGDTTIRDRRRQLVKQAEQLLAPLDQHKQEEWKKETKRLQQGSKRKHRHRQKRKLHVPTTA